MHVVAYSVGVSELQMELVLDSACVRVFACVCVRARVFVCVCVHASYT